MARSASATVRGIQTILKVLVAPDLRIDGIVGDRTLAAFNKADENLRRALSTFAEQGGFLLDNIMAPLRRDVARPVQVADSRVSQPTRLEKPRNVIVPPPTPVVLRPAAPTTDQARFVRDLLPAALAEQTRSGLSAALTIAQAALESNWGRSQLARTAKNLFGVKAHGTQWSGPTVDMRTREVVNGRSVTEGATWRAYDSYTDAVRDRTAFLKNNPRYTRAGLFNPGVLGDPRKEAEALARAGYATDPSYVSKVMSTVNGPTVRQGIALAGASIDRSGRIAIA